MSHEHAFLADISEHPDDDAPRLVYADWLEDHGDTEADRARAEFIRVQCELARLDEHALVRRAQLEAREAELLQKHGKAWSAPFRKYGRSFSFRRGFADRITLQAKVFIQHADEVAKLTPLCDVKLRECKGVVEELASCPHLGKLRSLSLLFNQLGVNRLRTLLASRHLKNLRSLDLSANSLSAGAGDLLAGAECLADLTDLTLDDNRLGAGFAAVARAPWLGKLRSLRARNTDLRAGPLRALLDGFTGGELRHLDLSQNPYLGDEGLEAIASSPGVGRLTTLALQNLTAILGPDEVVTPGEAGLRALARSPRLKRLVSLDLTRNSWSNALAALAAPRLPALRSLDLSFSYFGTSVRAHLEGFEAFVRSDFVGRLTALNLSYNGPFSVQAVRALVGSPALASLETLRLAGGVCRTARAWKALASNLNLPALAHLYLGNNAIGDPGPSALARCPGLSRLKTLDLTSNRLGEKGAADLASSPHLKDLAALDLRDNPGMGEPARSRLAERFGERVLL